MSKDKIWIVIPAYNEEKTIGKVIKDLKHAGFLNTVVVNDGSSDCTAKIAKENGARVFSHVINRGLGGALNTGISAALLMGADVIATFDADGQHDINDLKKAINYLKEKKLDVVIGSRLMDSRGMPMIRKTLNFGANLFTYLLSGVYVSDTQSGLRVFSRNAAEKIKIQTNRMEVSSEIINEIGRNKLKFGEIPIKAIYTSYSLEKGQKNKNAFKIIYKLIIKKMLR